MSLISAEMDIAQSLTDLYRRKLIYPAIGGVGGRSAETEVSGFIDGVPYGDIYRRGDTYLTEGDSFNAGRLYYVAQATPGSPVLLLQEDASPESRRARVVHMVENTWPEMRGKEVFVGVRSKANARFGPVRALFADREWHEGQQDVILAAPFWRGGFYIHIDGPNAWDEKYVSEMVNTGLEFTTRIYRFLVRVSPTRYELRNYELQGRWKSVINMDATAQVTAQTPIHDLPHGMPIVSYPDTPISGFSPVLENFDRRHAEKVGDYQVGGGPHHDPAPLWPPPPGKE